MSILEWEHGGGGWRWGGGGDRGRAVYVVDLMRFNRLSVGFNRLSVGLNALSAGLNDLSVGLNRRSVTLNGLLGILDGLSVGFNVLSGGPNRGSGTLDDLSVVLNERAGGFYALENRVCELAGASGSPLRVAVRSGHTADCSLLTADSDP